MTSLGLLGFGEAGQAIAASLAQGGDAPPIYAFDKARQSDDLSDYATIMPSPEALASYCDIIVSVVTADEAVNAARSIAPYLRDGQIFADGNSVSPGTKRQAQSFIEAAGAHYVDMAIMAPIHPRGHQTPLLLAGDCEAILAPHLRAWDFSFAWEGVGVGDASIVKMLRSVLIKGMESLLTESVTASEALGLDQRILQSAGKTLGISDMPALADYMMERAATHGRRRAAEMREVAKTLSELGLSNHMSEAIALYQDQIADMALSDVFEGDIPRDRAKLAPAMRKAQNVKIGKDHD